MDNPEAAVFGYVVEALTLPYWHSPPGAARGSCSCGGVPVLCARRPVEASGRVIERLAMLECL